MILTGTSHAQTRLQTPLSFRNWHRLGSDHRAGVSGSDPKHLVAGIFAVQLTTNAYAAEIDVVAVEAVIAVARHERPGFQLEALEASIAVGSTSGISQVLSIDYIRTYPSQ
jgi:hypothetical protein